MLILNMSPSICVCLYVCVHVPACACVRIAMFNVTTLAPGSACNVGYFSLGYIRMLLRLYIYSYIYEKDLSLFYCL
jgi:hypothetical protein